jgi:hypothetical protein
VANFSDFMEVQVAEHLFRTGTLNKPAGIWLALTSGIPHDSHTGGNLPELGVTRWALGPPSNSAFIYHNVPTSGLIFLGSGITPINVYAGSPSPVNVSGVALLDALTGGNVICHGALTVAKVVTTGDSLTFASGAISFQVL